MRIDFDQSLFTLRGDPFRKTPTLQDFVAVLERLGTEEPDLPLSQAGPRIARAIQDLTGDAQTLADLCYEALLSGKKAREGTATEKRTRAALAKAIANGGVVDLAVGDIGLLKEELEAFCTAAALLACDEALVEHRAAPTAATVKEGDDHRHD